MTLTNALAWTLIHFLWQGAVIAVVLAGSLALFKNAGSRFRYAAGCAAMMLMLISATATFTALLLMHGPKAAISISSWMPTASPESDLVSASSSASIEAGRSVADYFPVLVWIWFSGVVALSIRSLGGWIVAGRYGRRQTSPAEAIWKERFTALAQRLRVSRPVRLAISAQAQVPAVAGCLRPIVLMPASVFTGLSAEQVEALLAHELAHVRRHDYLINLLQTAAETLLFYHPGIWWVSHVIRNERENCCDDLAVETCGNTLTYARALAALEQLRGPSPRLAMAANGGSLLGRIQRLVGKGRHSGASTSSALLFVLIVAVAASLLGVAGSGLAEQSPVAAQPASPAEPPSIFAQQRETQLPQPAPAPARAQQAPVEPAPGLLSNDTRQSGSWLDGIEAAGFRNLSIEELIRLKSHGIDGEYTQNMRASGFNLSLNDIIRFRSHGIDDEYIKELQQAGFQNLSGDDLIRLRSHGVDADWVKEMQSAGFSKMSLEEIIRLRSHGIDPDFIREARKRFKDITLEQMITLRMHGIL